MSKNTRSVSLSSHGSRLEFAVNPESLTISYPQENDAMSLLGGEHIVMGGAGLMRATVETYLLGDASPMKTGKLSQQKCFLMMKRWKEKKYGVKLCVSGVDTGTFYITSMKKTVREGDLDWVVSIELVEKRELSEKRNSTRKGVSATAAKRTRSYTVKKGDTIWLIAKLFYGSGRLWRRIYDANRNAIKNPDRLVAGTKLKIPIISESEAK